MEKYIIYLKSMIFFLGLMITIQVEAQSYVTYNHDEAKMNQITVQEIGAGCLTPDFYYWAFHHSYQKSAASKNKLTYRTLAGVSAYPQVEDADSIEAALTKRAEIEALNIADRQIDIAWLAEGAKITDKLNAFQTNITELSVLAVRFMIKTDGMTTTISFNMLSKQHRMPTCPMHNERKSILPSMLTLPNRMKLWSPILFNSTRKRKQQNSSPLHTTSLTIVQLLLRLLTIDGGMPDGEIMEETPIVVQILMA